MRFRNQFMCFPFVCLFLSAGCGAHSPKKSSDQSTVILRGLGKDTATVARYRERLKSKDENERMVAAMRLDEKTLEPSAAVAALIEALKDPSPTVVSSAAKSLAKWGGPLAVPAIPALIESLKRGCSGGRALQGIPGSLPALLDAAENGDEGTRNCVLELFNEYASYYCDKRVLDLLMKRVPNRRRPWCPKPE
jgi:hypothetical protein